MLTESMNLQEQEQCISERDEALQKLTDLTDAVQGEIDRLIDAKKDAEAKGLGLLGQGLFGEEAERLAAMLPTKEPSCECEEPRRRYPDHVCLTD